VKHSGQMVAGKRGGKGVLRTIGAGASAKKARLSGYQVFCKEIRAAIVKKNPGMPFGTISKEMGAQWKRLSADEQGAFKTKAAALNEASEESDDEKSVRSEASAPAAKKGGRESSEGKAFEEMTLKELKEKCKEQGIKVSGKKDELVARLKETEEVHSDLSGSESDSESSVASERSVASKRSERSAASKSSDRSVSSKASEHSESKALEEMTMKELKEKCKEQGIKVSGKKEELVARLKETEVSETEHSDSDSDESGSESDSESSGIFD